MSITDAKPFTLPVTQNRISEHIQQATENPVWLVYVSGHRRSRCTRQLSHRLLAGCVMAMMDKLLFECPPEAPHGSVVKTVSFAAHRYLKTELIKDIPIFIVTLLTAAVRMVHEPFSRALGHSSPEQRLLTFIIWARDGTTRMDTFLLVFGLGAYGL
jgi:hypothetical protein